MNNERANQIDRGDDWEEKNVKHLWFHIIRDLVQSGIIAKVGPVPWAVYCTVKSHAGLNSGDAFPTNARIAEMVGRNENTVRSALKTLVDEGLLDVAPRTGQSSVYSVREQVQIKHKGGEPWATGERKYVPLEFQQFIVELERLAKTGNLPTDKGITINLVVQNIARAEQVNAVNHGDYFPPAKPAA